MPTYRIGIGSEFNLKDRKIGIGSDSPTRELDVSGTTSVNRISLSGVTTFTRYAGFTAVDKISRGVSLTGEHSTLEDIVVGAGETFTVSVGATVTTGTVESVSIGTHFSPPTGGIEDRPEVPVEGTVRFNTDLNTLEFYNGFEWRQFVVSAASGRGFFAGGSNPDQLTSIERIQIATTGEGVNYGDMVEKRVAPGCCSSSTRGIVLAGSVPGVFKDNIDYFTIAAGGQAEDFGNLTEQKNNVGALSSSTRGIRAGGGPNTNVMDYIEIATVGNALDFGDLLVDSFRYSYGASSPTRGLFMGGQSPSTPSAQIQYITIASKGNAHDFGDLSKKGGKAGGCSNTTRALAHSGPHIEYVTIASQGNAAYFGDLVSDGVTAGCASQTRAIWGDGTSDGERYETVEIASSGHSTSFGDMAIMRDSRFDGKSDSHGGLGGY